MKIKINGVERQSTYFKGYLIFNIGSYVSVLFPCEEVERMMIVGDVVYNGTEYRLFGSPHVEIKHLSQDIYDGTLMIQETIPHGICLEKVDTLIEELKIAADVMKRSQEKA